MEQILEQLKLIADFDGKTYVEFNGSIAECEPEGSIWDYDSISYLDYNSDFNLLMSVVEKIELGNYGFKMCRKVVEIYYDHSKETIIKVKEASRRESLFKAIVQFITWYNSLTKK